jgi:uncharacterized protein (TIGR00369 family)
MAQAPITGQPFPGVDTTFGFIFDTITPEEVTASFEVGPEHFQPAGIVHGGVYAALAESVASAGSHFAVVDDGKASLGVSNSTSFLRPVSEGSIHAAGRSIHRGRTTWVWEIDMTNDDGKLCAVSRVTIAIR